MRGKISPAIKQKAVAEIESGRLSQNEAARLHKSLGELHLHGVLAPPCRSFSFTLPH